SYADVFLLTVANHGQVHGLARGRGMDQVLQVFRTLDLGAIKSDYDVIIFQSRFTGGTILVDIGDERSAGVAQFQVGGGLLRDLVNVNAQIRIRMLVGPTERRPWFRYGD